MLLFYAKTTYVAEHMPVQDQILLAACLELDLLTRKMHQEVSAGTYQGLIIRLRAACKPVIDIEFSREEMQAITHSIQQHAELTESFGQLGLAEML